jgi:hypothetical protein
MLIPAAISLASVTLRSTCFDSERAASDLLIIEYQKVPDDRDFVAQRWFYNETKSSIVLTPAKPASGSNWSITGLVGSTECKIQPNTILQKGKRAASQFAKAVHAMDNAGLLRFPCIISPKADRGGWLFEFERLPSVPGGFTIVSVSKSGKNVEITQGE